MLEIMRYYNTKNHYIIILWDETSEEVVLLNKASGICKVFDDLKNMPNDMLRYIAEDFDSLINIDSSQIRYSLEDIGWIMKEKYGEAFLRELWENRVAPEEFQEF